jgi:hypothetical protein
VDEEHDETFDQAFQAYLKELGIKWKYQRGDS